MACNVIGRWSQYRQRVCCSNVVLPYTSHSNMDILTWYSSRIPKADQWSDQQKALQLHDATVYEKYIRDLTRCDLEHEQTARQHTSRPNQTLVILARNYAGTTEESWAYLKQMELLLSFRRLILFSICLVLSAQRDSDSDIEKLMWWVRADEKKRKSILKGTRWVRRTILTLVGRGWSMSRATELFFLGMTPIRTCLS